MSKFPSLLVITALIFCAMQTHMVQAQTMRIVTVNTLTGALTGTALGGATIALQNNYDDYPLRFGLGLGTIMGLGTGFYDLSKTTGGQGFIISGTINSTSSTGTIILLDTFYGATTGAIVGMAISLMSKDSNIVKGLQYGSGTGAWVGFAFGLVDAFFLSSYGNNDDFYDRYASNHVQTGALLEFREIHDRYAIGFFNPVIIRTLDNSPYGHMQSKTQFGFELAKINIAL